MSKRLDSEWIWHFLGCDLGYKIFTNDISQRPFSEKKWPLPVQEYFIGPLLVLCITDQGRFQYSSSYHNYLVN